MRRSTTLFLFPDINVWLALSYQAHQHHQIARNWFESLSDSSRLCFCRISQLGLLRLLTTESVMKTEILTQSDAWRVYDQWLDDERIVFTDEPATLEPLFRAASHGGRPATKEWTDAYLAAFAESAGFQLVTFDRGLHHRVLDGILLK
jgi:uncharacterized protein